MKLVLLSGGSGKRLWPLSNDVRSKQFLKVLSNSNEELESMVQRVWGQLRGNELAQDAYVATGKGQLEMIQSQIGANAPIIVEPERRDTFAAIALAATYLYSIDGVGLNEVVVILPVDPFVEDPFFIKIKQLENILERSGADLALIGVTPTYPSAKYGYILPKPTAAHDESENYATVSRFIEKPCEHKAKQLLEQHALWNCGVFAFKLNYMIDLLISKGLPIQYEELVKRYHSLPKISFDYEVVEKAKNVVVAPFEGIWKDLGTWNTLTEEMQVHMIGNGTISGDSANTHVINELDIPVVVMGLSDVVVAASSDGILVADKSATPHLKDFMKSLEQRPLYEERRWGSSRVLDYKKYPGGQEVLTKRIFISSTKNLSYQLHQKRTEIWTIIAGHGEVVVNGHKHDVKVGDVLRIPADCRHSVRALEDMEFIEVQFGLSLNEDDVVHLSMSWEDIMELEVV